MGLIRVLQKMKSKIIKTFKPNEEFTYEDYKNLERKKVRPSELEIRQRDLGVDGVSHDPRHRFW